MVILAQVSSSVESESHLRRRKKPALPDVCEAKMIYARAELDRASTFSPCASCEIARDTPKVSPKAEAQVREKTVPRLGDYLSNERSASSKEGGRWITNLTFPYPSAKSRAATS